jgi:hypothetical protein
MTVYTVFLPGDAPSDELALERAVFVKDGFSFPAFVFGAFWLLAKRLWLAGLLLAVIAIALSVAGAVLGFPRPAAVIISLLLGLLVGFEGPSLLRRRMERRGYREAGVVSGRNLEECEQRFFAHYAPDTRSIGASAVRPAPVAQAAQPSPILGLFPTAGGRV